MVRDVIPIKGKYLEIHPLDKIDQLLAEIWNKMKGEECIRASILEVMDLFGHFRFQRIERNYTKSEDVEFIRSLLGGTLRERYERTSEYRNTKLSDLN